MTMRSVPLVRYGVVDYASNNTLRLLDTVDTAIGVHIIRFGVRRDGSNSNIRRNGAGSQSSLQCRIKFCSQRRRADIRDGTGT